MKKSMALLSALVVSTTFIVNCQKAPDKRRVRPSGGSGTGSQSDVITEKAKLPTKVCSKEMLAKYGSFNELYKKVSSSSARVNANTTAEEAKVMQSDLVTFLDKCNQLKSDLGALGESENFSCLKDNGVKSEENSIMQSKVLDRCKWAGLVLEKDHNHSNEYSVAAKEDQKKAANAKEIDSKFMNKDFKISEEVLNMMYEGRTNFGSFLVEGEVKSTQNSLDQASAASKTICSAIGSGISKDTTLNSPVLEFTQFSKADKSSFKDVSFEYNDKATVVTFTIKSAQDDQEDAITTAGAMLCLNLEFSKLTAAQLETAFGKAITVAPAQVSTEVTGGTSGSASATTYTSADLAAAQPAGSPQEANLNAGMKQTIDNANQQVGQKVAAQQQQQAAASKTAVVSATPVASAAAQVQEQEEQEEVQAPSTSGTAVVASGAAVVSTNGSGGASAGVSATAQTKVSASDLQILKEKAERLEKEAKDAEAEVTKLTEAKAKAEDIDDAKAKARITRESANSAKAEYDAALKQA